MAKDSRSVRRKEEQVLKRAIENANFGSDLCYEQDPFVGGRQSRSRQHFTGAAIKGKGVMKTPEQLQAESEARAAAAVAIAKQNPATAARIADMMRISMGQAPSAPRPE